MIHVELVVFRVSARSMVPSPREELQKALNDVERRGSVVSVQRLEPAPGQVMTLFVPGGDIEYVYEVVWRSAS